MKYYPIFSPKFYKYFVVHSSFMALAQYVRKDEGYANTLRMRSRFGAHIILDNGVAEREGLTASELLEAANRIEADEVVIPDVQYDVEETLRIAEHFLASVRSYRTMLVVHGETKDEWRKTLDWVEDSGYRGVLGLPKYIDKGKLGRENLLWLIAHLQLHYKYPVHLLGVYGDLAKIEEYATLFPWIRSIDTAIAIAYTQHDVKVDDFTIPLSFEWDMDLPESYRDSGGLLEYNIIRTMEMCHAYRI